MCWLIINTTNMMGELGLSEGCYANFILSRSVRLYCYFIHFINHVLYNLIMIVMCSSLLLLLCYQFASLSEVGLLKSGS